MYYVTTWDTEQQRFTPQEGVSPGPHSKWELRKVLRELQTLAYDTSRNGGHSVLVERLKDSSL